MFAFLHPAALAAATSHANDLRQSLVSGGVERSYVVHLPSGIVPRKPSALVLAFHGHLGTGAGQARLSGLDALADRFGFIVVYPDGIDRSWNDGRSTVISKTDDLGFVRALLDDLTHRYPIDAKRVYATGMSNGAMFVQYLACNFADRIAAIAPVAGPLPADDRASCRPSRAISVLEIHGTADPIVPYGGGAVKNYRARGNGGVVLSVAETIAFWAHNAGCSDAPRTERLAPVAPADGTGVVKTTFADCRRGAAVTSYAIDGGGHTWRGGWAYMPRFLIGTTSDQLDASRAIVEFFLAHPR